MQRLELLLAGVSWKQPRTLAKLLFFSIWLTASTIMFLVLERTNFFMYVFAVAAAFSWWMFIWEYRLQHSTPRAMLHVSTSPQSFSPSPAKEHKTIPRLFVPPPLN
jgi:hypothetical protein